MTETQFNEIKNNAETFSYTSLNYIDFEEAENYELLNNDNQSIILYGFNTESKNYEYHWAANNIADLCKFLIAKNNVEQLSFVPKDWVNDMKKIGFETLAIWNEYSAKDLQNFALNENLHFVNAANAKEASEVTLSCKGQSRGFTGQTTEWIENWIAGKTPACPDYTKDTAILAEFEDKMAGIICIGTYQNRESTTLWIREVAVNQEYQRKGIGRKLIAKAYSYGIRHGANQAFLMADECNNNAIHLYQSMGFKPCSDEGQIDMIRIQ